MRMANDEARWVAQASAGDSAAFRRLVETYSSALFRVCARITGDKALAEDAVQEAFFNAYRHLREFDGRAAFSTWLHRIAVNAALEQMRKRHRVEDALPEGDDGSEVFADAFEAPPGPDRHATSAEVGRDIANQLSRMSTIERTAFVLRHHEGQSLEEISATLSLSTSASKQAIFRAVRKLRAALDPLDNVG
ncbi:MAG TPA: RNA polymerase sigma factor [Rhodanobacteraceae bacterium]|nr:RNA polymerase sigma factor [Rhodanobacteraceae bacterium]